MGCQETGFGPVIPKKPQNLKMTIIVLVIMLLLGIALDFGVPGLLRDLVVTIWDWIPMGAHSCEDFLKEIFTRRG